MGAKAQVAAVDETAIKHEIDSLMVGFSLPLSSQRKMRGWPVAERSEADV